MSNFRGAIIAALFATVSPVALQAADLPVAPVVPTVIAATPIWTGFYVGAHLGAGWSDFEDDTSFLGFDLGSALDDDRNAFFIGGLQAGYNWQTGPLVLGVEADVSFANMEEDVSIGDRRFGVKATAETDLMATARARVGYAFDRFMVYGTGGVAITHVETDVRANLGPFGLRSGDGQSYVGWVVGAGVEGQITPNLSARLEYLYADFGEDRHTFFGGLLASEVELDAHILRAGVNYKFNW